MQVSTKLMLGFGVYMILVGLGFYLFPVKTIELIHFSPDDDPWIRFTGMLIGIIGIYYVYAAIRSDKSFYTISIYGRYLVFVACIWLVFGVGMKSTLLMVAGNDVFWATLTHFFMVKEQKASP